MSAMVVWPFVSMVGCLLMVAAYIFGRRPGVPIQGGTPGWPSRRLTPASVALLYTGFAVAMTGSGLGLISRGRPPGHRSIDYTAFEVTTDVGGVSIRNAGPEALVGAEVRLTAAFDGGVYQGTRYFARWEPGQE